MTAAAVFLAAMLLGAEEPAASGDAALDKQRQEEVARLAPAKARMLTILVGTEEPSAASLHAQPLLRWSNPTAGSVHGEVFVWHTDGRPAAIASIFRWYHPFKEGTVEIVSLCPVAVQAREKDRTDWECRDAGVKYVPFADARPPAAARGVRLGQMRELARRFSAELIDTRGGESVTRELRLLNHPLHRYNSPTYKITDGALFALAEVTDPEVIVMIEAVAGDSGPAWRYALARMNNHEMQVQLDDRPVQNWARIDRPWADRRSNYTLFSFDPAAVTHEKQPARP